MNRRAFITLLGGAGALWPLAAHAQQPERMRRIGVFMGLREDDFETKSRLAKLRRELERLEWSEGSNLHMDIRFAPAGYQGSALAKELVALRPEVILAHTAQVTGALQRETRVIPIVFVNVSDPIGAGFVSNLARPSGNLTGTAIRGRHHWQVVVLSQGDSAEPRPRCSGGRPEESRL